MKYSHILTYALEHPWALSRSSLTVVADILARRMVGDCAFEPLDATVQERRLLGLDGPGRGGQPGDTAVIPVFGMIVPRADLFTEVSGMAAAEGIAAEVREAAASRAVERIVLDVDSPGGNIAGIPELAGTIREAAQVKPVVAVANHTMASAAYWLAAGATEIVATPSAQVGSIGVFTIHEDISKMLKKRGVNPTVISAGKFKVEDSPFGPLSDEAHESVKATVDEAFGQFVSDIAVGRGVTTEDVRNGFGEGRVVSAARALALGMVDRIGELQDVLGEATASSGSTGALSASADLDLRQRRQRLAALQGS